MDHLEALAVRLGSSDSSGAFAVKGTVEDIGLELDTRAILVGTEDTGDTVVGIEDTAVDTAEGTEGIVEDTNCQLGSKVPTDSWSCCNGWSLGSCSKSKFVTSRLGRLGVNGEMNLRGDHGLPLQQRVRRSRIPRLRLQVGIF